jgi:hypothetical protein
METLGASVWGGKDFASEKGAQHTECKQGNPLCAQLHQTCISGPNIHLVSC